MNIKHLKILLADDSITIQKLVNVSLAGKVHEIILSNDAQDALLKAKRMKPDLVLVDSELPNDSSQELCEKLRSELKNIKILLLEENGAHRLRSECDGNLSKPFNAESLLGAVENVMGAPSAPRDEDEEVTQVRGQKPAPLKATGPFSSFSAAEEFSMGTDVSRKLEAIASELMPLSPPAKTAPLGDSMFSKKEVASHLEEKPEEPLPSEPEQMHAESVPDLPSLEPAPSQAAETMKAAEKPAPQRQELPSFSKEELVALARNEIQLWIQQEMPKIAEKWIKAAISEKSQSS
jgi:CheY-like chemotaxis protein